MYFEKRNIIKEISFQLLANLLTPNVKSYIELILRKRKILIALLHIEKTDFVFNVLLEKLKILNEKLGDFEKHYEYKIFRKLVSVDEENWLILSEELNILLEKLENYHTKGNIAPFRMEIRLESLWSLNNTFVYKIRKIMRMKAYTDYGKKIKNILPFSNRFLEKLSFSTSLITKKKDFEKRHERSDQASEIVLRKKIILDEGI